MSKETVEILKAQLPLFEKMRRSAMLMYAMQGTITKRKLLDYINEVQTTTWQIINLNEHTIQVLEAKLNGGNHDADTTTSDSRSTAASTNETPLGDGKAENGSQLGSGGSAEINPATAGTPDRG